MKMNNEKPSNFQFQFPVLLVPCPMVKKTFKKMFCLWTSEIIQFIRFENHATMSVYLSLFSNLNPHIFIVTIGHKQEIHYDIMCAERLSSSGLRLMESQDKLLFP